MKIYTRTGDDGTTGLIGPGRVLKSDPRVEAYGSVDELNAVLGVARALDAERWVSAELETIQAALFEIGAELSTTTLEPPATLERLTDQDVTALERVIDRLEADLPELRHFILPGGGPLAAELQLARTVCRRAERRVVALGAVLQMGHTAAVLQMGHTAAASRIEPRLVRYLNRLADLLFVMARWCNHRAGIAEIEWRSAHRAG